MAMNILARSIMTIGCRDCDDIPKVADAGRIVIERGEHVQVMHNGLRVLAGGYHGDWMAQVIRGLRGHHEPQEERIFHALLPFVRHNSLVVELGSFWAYYALWFLQEIPGSNAFCVEPDPNYMNVGKRNAALNGMQRRVQFTEAWIGREAADDAAIVCESTGEPRTLPMLDMNEVLQRMDGQFIEMLHIDAQGAEHAFLGSIDTQASKSIRFLVLSTHHRLISGSPFHHLESIDMLRSLGAHILVEHDVGESFSGDGLIVASFLSEDRMIAMPEISRNQAHASLFGSA